MTPDTKSIFQVKTIQVMLTRFGHNNIVSSISNYYFNELTIIAFQIKENIILFVYNTDTD
jgi:hypothetical protein